MSGGNDLSSGTPVEEATFKYSAMLDCAARIFYNATIVSCGLVTRQDRRRLSSNEMDRLTSREVRELVDGQISMK